VELFPKIQRQYDVLEFQNSCIMGCQTKYLLSINEKHEFFIHNAGTKLSNLDVRRSDGKPMFVATSKQIESLPPISELVKELRGNPPFEKNPVVILLQRHDDKKEEKQSPDRIDDIDIKWAEEIRFTSVKQGMMEDKIVIERVFRYDSERLKDANHYLELKTGDKYIIKNVEILYLDDKEVASNLYELLTLDKHSVIARFSQETRPSAIKIRWTLGISEMASRWIKAGAVLGLIAPIASLIFIFWFTPGFLDHSRIILQLIAGELAALFGLRLLLFQDVELMSQWSDLYIRLIFFGIGVIVLSAIVLLVISPVLVEDESIMGALAKLTVN
jgi:hypothetical protein